MRFLVCCVCACCLAFAGLFPNDMEGGEHNSRKASVASTLCLLTAFVNMEASKSETAWNWIRSSPGDGNSVVTASDKKMRVKRSLLIGLGRAGSRETYIHYTVRFQSHLQWSTIRGEPGSWASAVLLVFDQRWIVGRFRSKNNALLPLHDCPALIPLRQMIKWSKCNNALMRLLAYSLFPFSLSVIRHEICTWLTSMHGMSRSQM